MTEGNDSSLTERQQYWIEHIRACDAAGQTSIDYARANGINVKSLYSARKALAEKGKLPSPRPSRFQKVQVTSSSGARDSQWHVQLPNGAAVSFGGGIDAAILSLVLNTVASLS
tara:strand:+ start:274 stop:615 length:342 start_codon:yes stop_codon:yes gene_type:complete